MPLLQDGITAKGTGREKGTRRQDVVMKATYNPKPGQCFACWHAQHAKVRKTGVCTCTEGWKIKRQIREAQEVNEGATYTDEEWHFICAVRAYQSRTGHKFPTFSEILAVAKSIGYRKKGK